MRFAFAITSAITVIAMLYELTVGLLFVVFEGEAPWVYTSYQDEGLRAVSPFSWQAVLAWFGMASIIYITIRKIVELEVKKQLLSSNSD